MNSSFPDRTKTRPTMKCNSIVTFTIAFLVLLTGRFPGVSGQAKLVINDQGYFEMPGLDVLVFDDYYPSGHQSGITIVQNGIRTAANGDIRLEGFAEKGPKKVDRSAGVIQVQMNYSGLEFSYNVQVKADGHKIIVTANLDRPLPEGWAGMAWFQIELFPAALFGRS